MGNGAGCNSALPMPGAPYHDRERETSTTATPPVPRAAGASPTLPMLIRQEPVNAALPSPYAAVEGRATRGPLGAHAASSSSPARGPGNDLQSQPRCRGGLPNNNTASGTSRWPRSARRGFAPVPVISPPNDWCAARVVGVRHALRRHGARDAARSRDGASGGAPTGPPLPHRP
jgi:hypothetical protein